MTSGAQVLLQYCDGGVTASWEEAHLGARAPRSHNTGKASPISSIRIERERRHGSASAGTMRFPLAVWPGCRIAGELSGNPRDRMNRTRGRCTGG